MISTSSIPGARFVDPKVLARIGNLELVARSVVNGFINGLHRTNVFGASVDFAEHRGYVAGDDIRRVDWRLYARTDRYYIKEYEADSNANFSVLLDISKSMGFGSSGLTKLEYAKFLAGCLTYLVHRQRDRVGLVAFDDDIVDHVPSSAKHMETVLHKLDSFQPTKQGSLKGPLHKMAEHFGRRGMLVLISDLYEEPDAIIEAIRPLRFRGNEVIVFHLLDEAELEFNFTDASAFEDLESGEQIPVVPEGLREEYRKMIRAHVDAIAERCSASRIDYRMFSTSTPLDHALFAYLSSREKLMKAR